jgi:heme/copper-type cytochrome/quinol oxidase subunit 2
MYMKSPYKFLALSSISLLPYGVSAQSAAQNAAIEAASFVDTFNQVILFPLIALLSAVAFLVFIVGCAQYFINATNDQARQQGVKHITFGIIGLVVMLSAFAILSIAANTFGLSDELECADNPSAGNCASLFNTSNSGSPTSNPGTPNTTSNPGTPTSNPGTPNGR